VTLFVLDTDHLSLYQRDFEPLLSKLLSHPPDELAITIITVEEQLRGRLAQIRKATTAAHLDECYRWLGETVDQLARLPVIYFDDNAATLYEELLSQKVRIGTQDLRIAAIVLSQNAVLLTRNSQDFSRVPGLQLDDWTV
jgi:tRNA(fMet)-specific endonuclease VapC